eukprot:gene8446-biopygen2681
MSRGGYATEMESKLPIPRQARERQLLLQLDSGTHQKMDPVICYSESILHIISCSLPDCCSTGIYIAGVQQQHQQQHVPPKAKVTSGHTHSCP